MKIRLRCNNCDGIDTYDIDDIQIGYTTSIPCTHCSLPINIVTENIAVGEKLEQETVQQVLKEGDIVRLDNENHVWHNQIALICGTKHKFYRLEINGKKIWVPKEWVKIHESHDINERDWE